METIRTGVTTDDVSYPATGTGKSFTRSRIVRFFPSVSTGGAATITILIYDGGEYRATQPIIVDDNEYVFEVEVDNSTDVNAYITGITGTIGLDARAANLETAEF